MREYGLSGCYRKKPTKVLSSVRHVNDNDLGGKAQRSMLRLQQDILTLVVNIMLGMGAHVDGQECLGQTPPIVRRRMEKPTTQSRAMSKSS